MQIKSNCGRWTTDETANHKRANGRNVHIIQASFDGISDTLDYIAAMKNPDMHGLSSRQIGPGAADWSGTDTYEQAEELARAGWPAGRAKLAGAMGLAVAATAPKASTKARYDVAGEAPDVGRYLAGDPACMLNRARASERRRPIVRVLASVSYSAIVSAHVILTRGAAILAQIDAWEQAGWSVELELCDESFMAWERHQSRPRILPAAPVGDYLFVIRNILKRAGEPIELDRLAFALLNPAMLRRINFALYEIVDAAKADACSYGSPLDLSTLKTDGDKPTILQEAAQDGPLIYLPSVGKATASKYETAAKAAQTLTPFFERAIYQHSDEQAA